MAVAVVLGTRPELVKMAPVMEALGAAGRDVMFIHTGQHYDDNLSASFIRDLRIDEPDHYLQVGSGTQAYQTAEVMLRLEKLFTAERPDMVLVQGDTNAVLSGALASVKMGIPVGHVEAGLRSNDRRMPEEYNRRITDHISHVLFAPTPDTERILRDEKVWGDIHMTGNTVIDACERNVKLAMENSEVLEGLPDDFMLVTAHRAENVDDPKTLAGLVKVLTGAPIPVVFPMHPRTKGTLYKTGLFDSLATSPNVSILPPVGYFDFLALMKKCRFIFTDSGGIQEEATSPSLRKRVLVFRKNTERPEAVEAGYARVVGTDGEAVARAVAEECAAPGAPDAPSPYGDGKAGERIAGIVREYLEG